NAGAEPPRSGRFRAPLVLPERREGAPAQPRRSPSAERRGNQLLDGRISLAQIFIHGQDEK
ncbi:MAG: hypothetical protein Q8N82_01825, partial [Deltaproteobacteria bacterium]|nr:hypothetical protein [Deltaproteobacteria bacterium]